MLSNRKLSVDLGKEAENEKRIGVEGITAALVKKLGLDKNNQRDKIEALDEVVKNPVDFVELDGEVDFVMPDENEEDESRELPEDKQELSVTFKDIRELENKLALIEHKNPQWYT